MDISIYHAQPTSTTSFGMCLFYFDNLLYRISFLSWLNKSRFMNLCLKNSFFFFFGLQPIYIRKKTFINTSTERKKKYSPLFMLPPLTTLDQTPYPFPDQQSPAQQLDPTPSVHPQRANADQKPHPTDPSRSSGSDRP